jgi:hypothetical protein
LQQHQKNHKHYSDKFADHWNQILIIGSFNESLVVDLTTKLGGTAGIAINIDQYIWGIFGEESVS